MLVSLIITFITSCRHISHCFSIGFLFKLHIHSIYLCYVIKEANFKTWHTLIHSDFIIKTSSNFQSMHTHIHFWLGYSIHVIFIYFTHSRDDTKIKSLILNTKQKHAHFPFQMFSNFTHIKSIALIQFKSHLFVNLNFLYILNLNLLVLQE